MERDGLVEQTIWNKLENHLIDLHIGAWKESQNHRTTECSGLEGTSVGHPAQPPAEARLPRAGCTGPVQAGFEYLQRRRIKKRSAGSTSCHEVSVLKQECKSYCSWCWQGQVHLEKLDFIFACLNIISLFLSGQTNFRKLWPGRFRTVQFSLSEFSDEPLKSGLVCIKKIRRIPVTQPLTRCMCLL